MGVFILIFYSNKTLITNNYKCTVFLPACIAGTLMESLGFFFFQVVLNGINPYICELCNDIRTASHSFDLYDQPMPTHQPSLPIIKLCFLWNNKRKLCSCSYCIPGQHNTQGKSQSTFFCIYELIEWLISLTVIDWGPIFHSSNWKDHFPTKHQNPSQPNHIYNRNRHTRP